jgi:hypothetical protein
MKEQYGSVFMLDDYGPFRCGKSYRVYGHGYDYVLLRAKGSVYCVSFNLIDGGDRWATAGAETIRKSYRLQRKR